MVSGESRSENRNNFQKLLRVLTPGMFIMQMKAGFFLRSSSSKTFTNDDPCHAGNKSKERLTVLLLCIVDGKDFHHR
jgi:hypothetical protein